LKLDAWIFPFLNVYGLVGWFTNSSTTRVHVGIPGPGPLPPVVRDLEIPTTIEGSGGAIRSPDHAGPRRDRVLA